MMRLWVLPVPGNLESVMNVQELRELLSRFPDDMRVVVYDDEYMSDDDLDPEQVFVRVDAGVRKEAVLTLTGGRYDNVYRKLV